MFDCKDFKLIQPTLDHGMSVFELIKNCPPLDTNSSYCNFLQCSHFSSTSVAAVKQDELVGFTSGYIMPNKPNTLFIWQIAVTDQARGTGLAKRMLLHLLERPACEMINAIETTITPNNSASMGLFHRIAQHLGAQLQTFEWLDKKQHFKGLHDSETLVRIGPFQP